MILGRGGVKSCLVPLVITTINVCNNLNYRFGRLLICSCSYFMIGLFGCLVTVMPNIILFLIMRVMQGAGLGGAIVSSYVLCVEYCGVRHREVVTTLFHLPLNVGHMSLAGISYLLRNYHNFQLAISVPAFIFAAMYWYLLESPKWLMDSNQIDKAVSVMEKIAKL